MVTIYYDKLGLPRHVGCDGDLVPMSDDSYYCLGCGERVELVDSDVSPDYPQVVE